MKTAVSIVMTRLEEDLEVYWVRRGDTAPFLSGFHSFPGGFVENRDIEFAGGVEDSAHKVAVIREAYEETGVLPGLRSASLTLVNETERPDEQGLAAFGLTISDFDLTVLREIGPWLSPAYLVSEFRTFFFYVGGETLKPTTRGEQTEVDSGEWIRPADALAKWGAGHVLLAPPTQHILRALANGSGPSINLPAESQRNEPTYSPIRSDVMLVPLRTPTLPPATHTNCYVLGTSDIWIVEPAAHNEEELQILFSYLDDAVARGARVRGIVLTHHHHDHIGGVEATMERYGVDCWAHAETASRLSFPVKRILNDGDSLPETGTRSWRVIFTPGHAPGHICLYSEADGTMIVGDMVAGVGTILIEPQEGDMIQYLESLERLAKLNPSCLLPSHGPAVGGAVHRLKAYISHRLKREKRVISALAMGLETLSDLVDEVYSDVPKAFRGGPSGGIAGLSLTSHLKKLVDEGIAHRSGSRSWRLVEPELS